MTIATFLGQKTKVGHAQFRPAIGNPQYIADIVKGTWSGTPKKPVEAIRHRVDTIEEGLKNFLFVPELFAKPNSPFARTALLASTEAVAKGAIGIIATTRPFNLDPHIPCLIVDNASQAIRRLAAHNRSQSQATFFAVTGSIGKSTTKNMIHLLASSAGPALRSIANYNGGMESVYFALSSLAPDHRYCAVEFSEDVSLDERMQFYLPQVAVITNIRFEHMDRMEREGYRGEHATRQLAYLAAGVTRHMEAGGICILNSDEENFELLAVEVQKSPNVRLITFGRSKKNNVRILSVETDAMGSNIAIDVEGLQHAYRLGVGGAHMAANSIAAATAVHFAGIPLDPALRLFETFKPDSRRGTRMQIPWHDGFISIRDETVSSSIPSLKSSFAQLELEEPGKDGRRIAVLGQVNDIGSTMPAIMAALAGEAELTSIDRFYTIGSDSRIFNEAIGDRSRVAPHFQTLDQLEQTLRQELRAGDTIVVKCTDKPANISLRRLVNHLTRDTSISTLPEFDTSKKPLKRIVIGGDTYFGETYQEKRARLAEINYLNTFGYEYSFKHLAPLLQRADYSVVNLECALTEKTSSDLEGRKDYILRGDPPQTIRTLKSLNVGGVLLGNNHSMDYLAGGLQETIEHVSRAGLAISGAGKNREEAQQPLFKQFDIDGIPFKLAILSGYEYSSSYEEMGLFAGNEKMGVNNINIDRLRLQIAGLKAEGYFVVVSPHWGVNYCFRTPTQSRLARRIIDIGADLILGHGPHMMNELTNINGVWVIYSLGNLVFNSEGEYERHGVQPYSLVAELELAREGKTIHGNLNLYPIVSCNQLTQFQPTFTDDCQFEQVVGMLKFMHYDSNEFMKSIELREVDGRRCMTMKIF